MRCDSAAVEALPHPALRSQALFTAIPTPEPGTGVAKGWTGTGGCRVGPVAKTVVATANRHGRSSWPTRVKDSLPVRALAPKLPGGNHNAPFLLPQVRAVEVHDPDGTWEPFQPKAQRPFTRMLSGIQSTTMSDWRVHPLFAGLPESALAKLEAAARRLHVPAGTPIVREGEPGDGLYVLEEGTVQIGCSHGTGPGRVLAMLGPEAIFGEMAVVEEGPRSAAVTTCTDAVVWFVPREAVLELMHEHPEFALRLLRELSRRLREFNRVHLEQTLQMERLALVGRFARTIIHDLKGPLNVLQLAAELGLAPHADPARREEALQRIRRQVERITDSIQEILLFTEGGSGTETMVPMVYADFLAPVLDELRAEVALRGACLRWTTANWPRGRVRIQPRRLRRVLQNLVQNACDMLPQGGQIEVRLSDAGRCVVTEVHDNGPGVAPEIRDRLFEPFVTHGKRQGTGLGLSICKRIVEDHGGAISAGCSPLGGALFRFTLPWAGI